MSTELDEPPGQITSYTIATTLDPLITRIAAKNPRLNLILTSGTEAGGLATHRALATIRLIFGRTTARHRYHLGVIHGVARYIAGIGPYRLAEYNLEIPDDEPFLFVCPPPTSPA